MPWSPEQWRAIAARSMREKGPKAGRAYLHKLKEEAGGHAVAPRGGNLARKLSKAGGGREGPQKRSKRRRA